MQEIIRVRTVLKNTPKPFPSRLQRRGKAYARIYLLEPRIRTSPFGILSLIPFSSMERIWFQ